MALPASVQKQADAANAIQASIIEGKTGKPAPQSSAPAPAVAAAAPAGENWEARFKGLQTTHQTTVEEMRTLRTQYDHLATVVDELRAKPAVAEPAPKAEPQFTDAEVKEYGESFLNMVARVAGQGNSFKKELDEVRNTVTGFVERQYQSEEDRFYGELDRQMPNWEAVNGSPEFKAWLSGEMPMTGQQRQKFLESAHKRFDVAATLEFFTAWQGESGVHVAPATVTTSNVIQDEVVDTEIYQASDIKRFYDEKTKGKWRGREDEARQIELKIFAAQNSGRVR